MTKNSHRYLLYIILVVFACVYGSISFVNHYNLRTFAFDLGIETNTIYDYAHFRANDCMLMQPQFDNVLSDHFSLLHFGYAWLIYIFGSHTLLVVQIAFILLGGVGIYKYVKLRSGDDALGLLAIFYFFLSWGIYSALAFDMHNNVIGAMLVPWFFYFFEKNNLKGAFIFFILVIIAKENMPLWTLFIALGLLLTNFRNRPKRNFLIGMAAFSAVYFVLVMNVFMPALANEGREYLHFEYHILGNNFKEVVTNAIKDPVKVFTLFFKNHSGEPYYDFIKPELHFVILLCGGISLFISPKYALMLLPVYGQKLFSTDVMKWGIAYHYCIEFVPIISIAAFSLISEINRKFLRRAVAVFAIGLNILTTWYVMYHGRSNPYLKNNFQIFEKDHYIRSLNVKDVYDVMKLVPPDAKVSASSETVPHLSLREYIYQFPVVGIADHIFIIATDINYPLSPEDNRREIDKLLQNPEWELVKNQGVAYLFRKKN